MPSPDKKRAKRNKRGPLMSAFDGARYRAGEYSLRGFVRLLPHLPAKVMSGIASAASAATFGALWRYRARMERNLALAMAQELPSREQRKAVVRRAWRNFAQCLLETTLLMHAGKERL